MRVVRLSEELPVDDVQAIATELADSPDVVSARPDIRVHIAAERVSPASVTLPNDTYTADLWGLWDSSRTGGGFGTRAAAAWPTTRGAGAVVAVLDTGIQAHPDLNANLVSGYDFVNDWWAGYAAANDGNGRDPDPTDPGDWCGSDWSSWHGTHVAGTIAAVADDAYGVAGVAPAAKVQPVRVLGRCGGYSSDILAAITWASGGSVPGVPANATPADAINLSLGGPGTCYSDDQSIIDAAIARGTSIVVAAGNENQLASNSWPANCSGVITVAASTRSGQRASYSNYGAAVEIAGPGGDWSAGVSGILSTLNTGSTTPGSPTWA
ncbi:MAG: serine protease, partial [Actinobacteria bacterium]|nr:serine protease [Actinomycetota bacterium]